MRSTHPPVRFTAPLKPVPHGGLYVIVPPAVVRAAQLAHGARVKGTVNDVEYRSSLMKYSGAFHLGVHKATVQKASVGPGDRVEVTLERDKESLPTDIVPTDRAGALARAPRAAASWQALSPARRREYVKGILEAKQLETRAGRIARIVQTLAAGVPKRPTWQPKR